MYVCNIECLRRMKSHRSCCRIYMVRRLVWTTKYPLHQQLPNIVQIDASQSELDMILQLDGLEDFTDSVLMVDESGNSKMLTESNDNTEATSCDVIEAFLISDLQKSDTETSVSSVDSWKGVKEDDRSNHGRKIAVPISMSRNYTENLPISHFSGKEDSTLAFVSDGVASTEVMDIRIYTNSSSTIWHAVKSEIEIKYNDTNAMTTIESKTSDFKQMPTAERRQRRRKR